MNKTTNNTITNPIGSKRINTVMVLFIILSTFYFFIVSCLCWRTYREKIREKVNKEKFIKIMKKFTNRKPGSIEPDELVKIN